MILFCYSLERKVVNCQSRAINEIALGIHNRKVKQGLWLIGYWFQFRYQFVSVIYQLKRL